MNNKSKTKETKMIFPYREENYSANGKTITETSFLLNQYNCEDSRQNKYTCIKTIKNDMSMTIDEYESKIERAPENAIFNVAQGWNVKRFDDFLESINRK